jgi:hypothetical protein
MNYQISKNGYPVLTVNGNPQIEVCVAGDGWKTGDKWAVVLWTYPNVIPPTSWHIINLETGKTVSIGRVTRKWTKSGINYFDRAEQEAARRNAKEREKNTVDLEKSAWDMVENGFTPEQ